MILNEEVRSEISYFPAQGGNITTDAPLDFDMRESRGVGDLHSEKIKTVIKYKMTHFNDIIDH